MINQFKLYLYNYDFFKLEKIWWQLENWYINIEDEQLNQIKIRINDILDIIKDQFNSFNEESDDEEEYNKSYAYWFAEIEKVYQKFFTIQHEKQSFYNQRNIKEFCHNLKKIGFEKHEINTIKLFMFKNNINDFTSLLSFKTDYAFNRVGPFYHMNGLSNIASSFFRVYHNLKYFNHIDKNHLKAFFFNMSNENCQKVGNLLQKSNNNKFFRKVLFKTIKKRLNILPNNERVEYIEYLENFNINFKLIRKY
jgi:hypothetical protein